MTSSINDTEPRPPSLASQERRSDVTARLSSAGNSLSSKSLSLMEHGHWKGVRTLPTWVQRREEDDADPLPPPPIAHHPSRPPERSIHDAHREATPVTLSPLREQASRWRGFAESSVPPATSHSEKLNDNWLSEDLDGPWLARTRDPDNDGGESHDEGLLFVSAKSRRRWYKRIHVMLLNNPVVPLTFRAIIWIVSLIALALACSVFQLSENYNSSQKPSTIMAIIVDVVALIYLVWITYDEYSGKPLGLRSPKSKMKLIMFDLLFIIFDAANLSLAFDTLFDVRWNCRNMDTAKYFGGSLENAVHRAQPICSRQRALVAFLFLALCAWIMTFTISVFRLVERVSRN